MSQFGTDSPLLDARLHGTGQIYTATAGQVTDFYYTIPFDCKFNGLEIISDNNVLLGDSVSIQTEYNAGLYGWKRYKKFGKNWNIKADDKTRIILFPTEPSAGVRIKFSYASTGNSNVNFVVNLFTFVDQEIIKPSILEEGEDW